MGRVYFKLPSDFRTRFCHSRTGISIRLESTDVSDRNVFISLINLIDTVVAVPYRKNVVKFEYLGKIIVPAACVENTIMWCMIS